MKPAIIVERPSPIIVLCKPGFLKKSRLVNEFNTIIWPMCSVIVTKAIGAMAKIAAGYHLKW